MFSSGSNLLLTIGDFSNDRQIPLRSHAEANILWCTAHPTNCKIYELHSIMRVLLVWGKSGVI